MNLLNKVIGYWHDCIKSEDALEKGISSNGSKNAVLYPFEKDFFIFDRKESSILISGNERLCNFSKYVNNRRWEAYYGYPILFYYDSKARENFVAPLFVIKVKFIENDSGLYLQKDEQFPTCGIQAFSKIGFHTDVIGKISEELDRLFRSNLSSGSNLADKCLEVIEKEYGVQFKEAINEAINPSQLSDAKRMSPGIYNKSVVFAGEDTNYNRSLLQDLSKLKQKSDLYIFQDS